MRLTTETETQFSAWKQSWQHVHVACYKHQVQMTLPEVERDSERRKERDRHREIERGGIRKRERGAGVNRGRVEG